MRSDARVRIILNHCLCGAVEVEAGKNHVIEASSRCGMKGLFDLYGGNRSVLRAKADRDPTRLPVAPIPFTFRVEVGVFEWIETQDLRDLVVREANTVGEKESTHSVDIGFSVR